MASSAHSQSLADAMRVARKVHTFLMNHKDAGPFLEKVDWKNWGLPDYPLIIKKPMDLGLIQRNLDNNVYKTPQDWAKDVHLVWDNCMVYNKEGSEYYMMAQKLKKVFEDKYNKQIKWSGAAPVQTVRAPTLGEKRAFSQHIHLISSTDLGKVVSLLDDKCPQCIKKVDADDIEIDIDSISGSVFWEASTFVESVMPTKSKGGASSARKKRRGEEESGQGKHKRSRK